MLLQRNLRKIWTILLQINPFAEMMSFKNDPKSFSFFFFRTGTWKDLHENS